MLCPCCKVREATGNFAIVDRDQKMEKSTPEPLCDVCANDMRSGIKSDERVEKVAELK
jgi:protein-arginine kinase activator protein McsA